MVQNWFQIILITRLIPFCDSQDCRKNIVSQGPVDGWIIKGINKVKEKKAKGSEAERKKRKREHTKEKMRNKRKKD